MNPHVPIYPYGYIMTYLPDTSPQNSSTPHPVLPGLPCGPDTVDTSGLRAIIPALIARIATMVCPDGVERGALSRLWEARRLFATLFRAEQYNLGKWLNHAMQADPDWQTQVREDLGGEEALARWEARLEQSQIEPADSPAAKPARGPARANTVSKGVRTDRHNLFRLAPIMTGKPKTAHRGAPLFTPGRNAWISISRPAPIPLTPDQLRPRVRQAHHGLQSSGIVQEDRASVHPVDNSVDKQVYNPANNYGDNIAQIPPRTDFPSPTRQVIMAAWDYIYDRYCLFNYKIMDLDLMMTIPICRRMPMPA